jgi:hypothetical protein
MTELHACAALKRQLVVVGREDSVVYEFKL